MASSYRLPDEPRPSGLVRFSVNPVWPLLAVMLAGPWLSWTWFVFNAWALGSASRVRESVYAVGGFVGGFALYVLILVLLAGFSLPEGWGPYLVTLLTIWKIGVSYAIVRLQRQGFGLFAWYGGKPRNGAWLLFAGFLLRDWAASIFGDLRPVFL